jgi:ethanolamine utilization protein EutA
MPYELEEQTSFSNAGRILDQENEIQLVSVGVDIGTSTSHLVFSRIVLIRINNRYTVSEREILFESEVLLTPHADDLTIDADTLGKFIKRQYHLAGLTPKEIDTGALILTGVAVRRSNARAIGDLFSDQAGKFVAVSAGDGLETMLVANGSGAVALSANKLLRVMNVDIGGGTSKIAVCSGGEIVDLTVIDVGARIMSFDKNGVLVRIEEAGRRFAKEAGITLDPGDVPTTDTLQQIVELMADRLFQAMSSRSVDENTKELLRLDPLELSDKPDVVMFSGGVSEYIYGREKSNYGDLGPMLAAAISSRVKDWGPEIQVPVEGLRATVVGASQYTIQVSGNTIFVTPHDILPMRNIPVISPVLPLDSEVLDEDAIAQSVERAINHLELHDANQGVALHYRLGGSATYSRLDAFCKSVIRGMAPVLSRGLPLVMVSDGDVGGLIGIHCHQTCKLDNPVVSIDGILLNAFDFIDIGALLDASGTVPVIIKSLVFPMSDTLDHSGVHT